MIINSKTYREDLLNRFELTSSLSMPCKSIKGTLSPQAHARVDEKYFEIVGPTF